MLACKSRIESPVISISNYFFMAFFRLLNSDGSPASSRQVIIKNPGIWDYGISDRNGQVNIPHQYDSGTIVVGGQTIYMGSLSGTIYLP